MFIPDKEFLFLFGWSDFFENQLQSFLSETLKVKPQVLFPARVICEERNLYRVQVSMDQVLWASATGKMQFKAKTRSDYPAVGDWVLIEMPNSALDRALIHHVLERKTLIHRKQIGSGADPQILSTNVDYAFIATSLNADLNYRRIERYLAVVREAKVFPVILLTKTDICLGDLDQVVKEVQKEFPDIPVQALSKNSFEKEEFLRAYFRKGTTSVFLGSSGVGKSTLVNFLIGQDVIKTQDIRESDEKGRHTTTSRNLYISRYGGAIIDTPGMRELQLSDHAEGVRSQFSDIDDLIQNCRFRNCQHQTEPGCAVKDALEEGFLSEEKWGSFQKLQAEIRHGMRKQDRALAAQDRKVWKKLIIQARTDGRRKRGFKN